MITEPPPQCAGLTPRRPRPRARGGDRAGRRRRRHICRIEMAAGCLEPTLRSGGLDLVLATAVHRRRLGGGGARRAVDRLSRGARENHPRQGLYGRVGGEGRRGRGRGGGGGPGGRTRDRGEAGGWGGWVGAGRGGGRSVTQRGISWGGAKEMPRRSILAR